MSTYLKNLISRLTPEARAALDMAVSVAVEQKHAEIQPAHLLMALIRNETPLFEALGLRSGLRVSELFDMVCHALGQMEKSAGVAPVFAGGLVDWLVNGWLLASTVWGRHTLHPAAMIAALLEHDEVLTLTPYIRRALSCDRASAQTVLEGGGAGAAVPAPERPAENSAIARYTRNLSEQARRGELDPVLGRETEIRQVIDILLRRRQNNPILTGEPGVGKTALVEGLALRIAAGTVPEILKSVDVLTLDLGLLQAGASVKGEFENRLSALLRELSLQENPGILFIDEVHTLIGAGGQAGQNDAANFLKPALARGELRVIGATTWAEYKRYFEKDAALTRRFQVINVAEPDTEKATTMLRAMAPALSQHHGIPVLESAIHAAVRLSARYIAGRQLPDKSVSLLDTACARVAVSQLHEPKEIEAIGFRLRAVESEYDALRREESTPERLQKLAQEAEELQARLAILRKEWHDQKALVQQLLTRQDDAEKAAYRDELARRHRQHAMVFACVDATCVADVVSDWTGIPLGRMLEREHHQLDALFDRLAGRIIGQQHALKTISRQIRINRSGLGDPHKPTGVFLLAGPSGTGKTETSLALAELLYGGEQNLVTINMSEYQEAHSVSGLKGSPPGYVGYGQGGVLTEAVRRNPYSVVLLDEIEKAHPDVMEIFYQVFDKGMIEDAEGQTIDFRNTLIIMTSNLASRTLAHAYEKGHTTPEALCDIIRPEFEAVFSPALMGRMTLIPYYPLSSEAMAKIIQLKLNRISERYRRGADGLVSLLWDSQVVSWVEQRCMRQQSGARDIDQVLNEHLLPLLADRILKEPTPGTVAVTVSDQELILQTDGAAAAAIYEEESC